jgi:hypothetical protein
MVKGLGRLIGYGFIGLIGLIWSLTNLWLSLRCKFWIIVDGQIKDSSTDVRQYRFKSYYPFISYTYNVNGVAYEGNRIRYGSTGGSKSVAHNYFQKYPAGKKVKISIDPNNYGRSVLEPGVSANTIVWIIIFSVLTAMGYRALLAYLQAGP